MKFNWEEIANQRAGTILELEEELGDLQDEVSELYFEIEEVDEMYSDLWEKVHALLRDIVDRHPESIKDGKFNWTCPHLKALAEATEFNYIPKEGQCAEG